MDADFSSSSCLDMAIESDQPVSKTPPNLYETIYVTSHKAPCRAGAFSANGGLIATGSVDASIKILDVDRMISKSISHAANYHHNGNESNQAAANDANQQQEPNTNQSDDNQTNTKGDSIHHHNHHNHHQTAHPVIRTLYDHTDEVTFLEFNPAAPILASGSLDMTIKFYDYAKANAKRALKTIQEASPVRCFTFHPSGGFMLVGCQQPTLRLYDTSTIQAFVSCNPLDQHVEPITMIDYNKTGSSYASSSKDGDIKIWDGVSNRCINTLRKAHDGAEISSVRFSRNGKYLLSAGKDHLVKLWDISMSSCLLAYQGASNNPQKKHRAQATFNHSEEFILFPDSRNTTMHVWNSRTGEHLTPLALCHNNSVRFVVHSDVSQAFLTCSEDYRARFWTVRDKSVVIKRET